MNDTAPVKVRAAQRRAQAVGLRVQGSTYRSIAAELGTSPSTAHRLVEAELRRLAKLAGESAEELRALELARLDAVMVKAHEGWERSLLDAERTTTRETANGTETTRVTRTRSGDARYLNIMLQCIAQRIKLLGLEAPQEVAGELKIIVKPPPSMQGDGDAFNPETDC